MALNLASRGTPELFALNGSHWCLTWQLRQHFEAVGVNAIYRPLLALNGSRLCESRDSVAIGVEWQSLALDLAVAAALRSCWRK